MLRWGRLLLACLVTGTGLVSCPALGGAEASEDPSRLPKDKAVALTAHELLYVSDYFSFVGQDPEGRVAFALDTNRGRDGREWQAEHVAVLHVEGHGWVEIEGAGRYPNEEKTLAEIPDSAAFQFDGTPLYGFVISSPPNGLTLRIGPITEHLARDEPDAQFRMGSAPAVLAWGGRVLEGRVIHEHLLVPDYNRLSRVYVGTWNDFQAFYAVTEAGGDLYLHSQKSGRLSSLVGKLDGFLANGERVERLSEATVTVLGRELALGAYRWPTQWRIEWPGEETGGPRVLELTVSDHRVMSNWVLGGFAMGIVTGTIVDGERTRHVYGLAEVLM